MVRETRHLWVGNLPHNIREERILEHFKRYGKVQSVKILPKKDEESGTGVCATVAFIDIKSAAKAHNAENKVEERTLKTDYYEPPASSTASSAIFIHERDDSLVRPTTGVYAAARPPRYQHGLTEDRTYDRATGHYYDRVAEREPYLRRPMGMGYHDDDGYQGRGKSRDRYQRTQAGTGTYQDGPERTQNHFRGHNATRQHFDQQRYPSEQYNDERDTTTSVNRITRRPNSTTTSTVNSTALSPSRSRSGSRQRQHKRRSPSHSPSGSRSNSRSRSRSRSRSTSGSHSSSSSSKLRSSSSDSSSRSRSPSKSRSPAASYGSQGSNKAGRSLSSVSVTLASVYLPSAVSTAVSNNSQVTSQVQGCMPLSVDSEKDEKRPLGICVKNLPVRSTDTSLKDGLFHEYKKHGKVTMVKVIGQGTDRYAVVCFKKTEDVDKALEVSKDKLFFGCRIEVTAHEGIDGEDNEFRPLEAELDEYHPKATRTLFIGNLEKDITTVELRKHFEQFGEIIEIDIKKQGSSTSYAFIQYSDVASVVKAMRKLDGENLGANRIKLGFGKSMPTNCVWLDGITDSVSEKFLARNFSRFGIVCSTSIDREKGHSLIFYESVEYAQVAVQEMRGRMMGGKRLQVDFASRECQNAFFDKMEMTGQILPGERPWERRERRGEFEVIRDDRYGREARVGFDNRNYARYDNQQRVTRGTFSRGTIQRGAYTKGKGQGFPGRFDPYHEEFGDRWHRNFDEEYSQTGVSFEDSYEHELREYGYSQRERREYANDDRATRGRSFSPVRRRDAGSTSPTLKERHREDVSDSPHARIDRPAGRVEKYDDHHSRERYNSRDDDMEEAQSLDGKSERSKFSDSIDRQVRKKNKHRNSVSDQDSHHSQSPPRSRHQSRSTSPPSKEKKPQKERERSRHRTKSPSSHSSSRMNSPVKDIVAAELIDEKDICCDQKDSAKHKLSDNKTERDPLSLVCLKQDDLEKVQIKSDLESLKKRIHSESETDHLLSVSEAAGRIERKKRLLISAGCILNRDAGFLGNHVKEALDQTSTKIRNIIHGNTIYSKTTKSDSGIDSIIEGAGNEECKSDAESGELLDEVCPVKVNTSECANSDLKYLKKKQVHLLHLLEQLGEGMTSSDTECSTDSDKPDKKIRTSGIDSALCSGREQIKNSIKQEMFIINDTINSKDSSIHLNKQKDTFKSENSDNSSILRNVDTMLLKKYHESRKPTEHSVIPPPPQSVERTRRFSTEKETFCHSDSNQVEMNTDNETHLPSGLSDTTWKKQTFPTLCITSAEDNGQDSGMDSSVTTQHTQTKDDDYSVSEVTPSTEGYTSVKSCRTPLTQKSVSESVCATSHELRREREISPLSLPLPKFAASLRSPKMSPNPLSSPKGSAMSPRAGHSPNIVLPGKANFIHEITKVDKTNLKDIQEERTVSGTSPAMISSQLPKSTTDHSSSSSLRLSHVLLKPTDMEISSDSEYSPISSPNRPSIEERIRALDEKFNAWSGSSRTFSTLPGETSPTSTATTVSTVTTTATIPAVTTTTSTADYLKYNIKKRPRFSFLSPEFRTEPSEIVKSLLAKSTIFDQDSKRLERINEKYEPKEVKLDFTPKTKPLVRTKAAAKEFSIPIHSLSNTVSSLTSMCATKHSQFTQSAIPVSNSSSAVTTYSGTTSSLVMSTQCAVPFVPNLENTPIINKMAENENLVVPKLSLEHVPALSKLLETIKPQSLWKDVTSVTTTLQSKPTLSCTHSNIFNVHTPVSIKKEVTPVSIKDNMCISIKKEPREDKNNQKKEFFMLSCQKDIQCKSDSMISMPLLKEHNIRKDVANKENTVKKENIIKDIVIKQEPAFSIGQDSIACKRENSVKEVSGSSTDNVTLVQPVMPKRRVSSIDSNESDSGRSARSADASKDCHDTGWQKDDQKTEASLPEPEHKKPKLSHNVKSSEKEKQREKSSSPTPPKKPEKLPSRIERSKSLGSRSSLPVVERDEIESRSVDMKYIAEGRDRIKSETKQKDERKTKCKESKGNRHEHRAKSKWSDSAKSDKSDKLGQSSSKGRKDHDKFERERNKSERKLSGSDKGKHDLQRSKSKSELKHNIFEEEPVYFSMYDKVKARSSQNQTLKDQAKDLETVRQKFNLLKQSRAKREEKSRSVEMDSDKDSDASHHSSESETQMRTSSKTKQSRKRKLVIESSSDDDIQSQNTRTEGSRNDCRDTSNEFPSDLEAEYRDLTSVKKFSVTHNSKRKGKRTGLSDSGSSGSDEQSNNKSSGISKKKTKSNQSLEKVTKRHNQKSDYDTSDTEIIQKSQNKEKEHKKKKTKKEKMFELVKSDTEGSENETARKFKEEDKLIKCRSFKECEDETSSVADDAVSRTENKEHLGTSSEKPKLDSKPIENADKEVKHKSTYKKKKKSKKSSKIREKKLALKPSELSSYTQNEAEHSKLQDTEEPKQVQSVSPKPEPYSREITPQSPPCLRTAILSDNDFKSDFSDFEFDSQKIRNAKLNSDLWKPVEPKMDLDIDICTSTPTSSSKCENFSCKDKSDNPQCETELSLPLFLEKAEESCLDETTKSLTVHIEQCVEHCEKNNTEKSFSPLIKEVKSNSAKKDELDKKENSETEGIKKKEKANNDTEKGKEERKKKKSKKTTKEKRKKSKSEHSDETDVVPHQQPITQSSTPIFEKLSIIDEDSRLSNIRLDEEIAEEARRLEQELLAAASEETSTFGDSEDPCKKEEKAHERRFESSNRKEEKQERRFEEEAAKETRRLEEELLSTARDPWNLKDTKPYDDDSSHELQILTEPVSKEAEVEVDTENRKEDNIYMGIELGSNSNIGISHPSSQDFLLAPVDPDQYKLEDKEAVYDMDNQRKIEDDLAVSALLQEMNNEEVSAPELTKETDYLEPLLESQDNGLNYLLPDETTSSLQIAEPSPEINIEENVSDTKCDTEPGCIPEETVTSEQVSAEEIVENRETVLPTEDTIVECKDPVIKENPLEKVQPCEIKQQETEEKLPEPEPIVTEDTFLENEYAFLEAPISPESFDCKKQNSIETDEKETNPYSSNEETCSKADDAKLTFEDVTTDAMVDDQSKKEIPPTLERVDTGNEESSAISEISVPAENEETKSVLEDCINENTNLLDNDEQNMFLSSDPVLDLGDDTRTASPPSYPALEEEMNSIREEIGETKELFGVHNICANNIEQLFNTDKSHDAVKEMETTEKQKTAENVEVSEAVKTTDNSGELTDEAPAEAIVSPVKVNEEVVKADEFLEQPSNKEITECSEKETAIETTTSNLFDGPLSIVTDQEEKKHTEKPKRGRRPKTRKYSEPSVSLTRHEVSSSDVQISNKGSRRGRPTSMERSRRSLRSETAEILASEQQSSDNVHLREDNLSNTVTQENPNVASVVANNEYSIPLSCTDEMGETTEEINSTEEKEITQLPNDVIVCCKTSEHVVEQLKEEPRKRGRRRKKGSSDHHSSYFSPPSDKNDSKFDENDPKDHHKPKESRLWLSISSDKTLSEHKLGSKETSNAYDVFEFRDSDEEITFERDLQSSMKERLLDSTRTSYGHDHRHHDSKSAEVPHEKEKKHDEPRHKSHHHDDRDTAGKEYVTELSQHGKISITIRLHQKEGHDGSSTGTAEVVKTSEAVCAEDHKIDSSRSDKSSTKDSPNSDGRSIAQGRSIRKSTRLQCQNARTTVDEVIEEVVKGHFKSSVQNDSLGPATPIRVTRRTRSRRSEEIANQQSDDINHLDSSTSTKAKNEPVFVILDNTVKEYSTEVKKCLISSQDVISSKTASTVENETSKSETKMSLRSYRITRSSARMEANRDSLLSPKSSQDRETANDTSSSISWSAKNENQGAESTDLSVQTRAKDTLSSTENLQARAPLPVLKVELPKVASSEVKAGENDDSDSRSSPTVLIDPVTGFLTPVSKNADTPEMVEGHLHLKGSRTLHSEKLSSVITSKMLAVTSVDSSTISHSSELLGPLPDVVVKKCSVEDSSHSHRTCVSPKMISSTHQATAVSSGNSVTQTTSVHHIAGSESRIHQPATEEETSEKSVSQTVITTPPIHPMSTSSFPETKVSVSGSTITKPLPPVGQPQVSIGQVANWPVTTVAGSPYHVYGSLPTQSAITSQSIKTRSSSAGYPQSTRSTVVPISATNSQTPISDASQGKIVTPQKILPSTNSPMNSTSDGESKNEAAAVTVATIATTSSPVTTTTVTLAVSQPDMCTVTTAENLSSSERQQFQHQSAQLQSHSKVDVSCSWSVCKTPPSSRSLMSNSEASRHAVTTPSISPPRTTSAIVSSTVIKTEHHSSQQMAGVQIKTPYSASSKQTTAFLHKPGLPVPAYEAATHSSHGLMATGNSGGVIAELLQNPQLLQQHKDYFAASQQSVSNSAQIGDRIPTHLVRPASSTPTIPTDLAARLGNPTPPHTPTPPVTSATHPLQPSDIHPAHVAGLHLRQPPLIVPSHSSLGIHSELNAAFVHQQMMYAASHPHPHYAAIHPDLRAQQEAQARAAAMGIAPRFPYPHVPPNATAPSGFRQPPEPRQHISVSDSKSDAKPLIESSKTAQEHRIHEEREKANQSMKVVRIKQEYDRDVKSLTEIKGHSTLRTEEHEPSGLEGKQLSAPSGPLTVGGMRPTCVPYPPSIRHPHLSISTHERITDSPVVANLYAQGQLRTTPLHLVVQPDDHKGTENHQHPQVVKTEITEKDTKPPIAHQNPPTTVPYHSLDALGHHNRQSSMSMPSVGSPAPGYLDGRPHLAHSTGALPLKTLVPPLPVSQTHSVPSETRSNHESHKKTRTHSHQGPSQSPGLNTAHSPLPVPPNFPSHSSHPTAVPSHAFPPPSSEPIHRRGSLHLIPQMGSEAPIHAPPPAHAMSQPAGVPRTQPQTPPHASQVPPQGDSFLLQRYPVMWQGLLALKNDQAAVQMHFVSGNPRIARASLPPMTEGGTPPVRIAQRMRLEQTQLEGVARKMQMVDEHCILLALPCGRDHMDVLQQSNNLRNGFINYLQLKQAAGIVNAAAPGSQQPAYVIHIFPSCEFSNENMARIAPDLLHSVSDIAHLLIIIATV